jgi:hypothetical protein
LGQNRASLEEREVPGGVTQPGGRQEILGKYERAKITERSRRGKLRKAREGNVVAGHTPNFGFRFNESRDAYEVDEEKMTEHDRDTLMEHYAGMVSKSLDNLSPEERNQIYKLLHIEVLAYPDNSLRQ